MATICQARFFLQGCVAWSEMAKRRVGRSVRGRTEESGSETGKPDFGSVRWETQYVGYTGDDRTVYWVLTAQYVDFWAYCR